MADIIRTRETVYDMPDKLAKPYGCYSNEYGKRGNVYSTPSGVYVRIHTDPTGFYPIYKFANMESFDAYRREVDYVDREHRLPGVNPHAQPWII